MNNVFDSLITHLQMIERHLGSLAPIGAFAFALACTERQVPVYVRASTGKPWDSTVIRKYIDQAWECTTNNAPFTAKWPAHFQRGIPSLEMLVDPCSVTAHLISNSVFDLLTTIDNRESGYCHFPASKNIELLEMLFDECKNESSKAEVLLLIDTEINLQVQQVNALQASSDVRHIRYLRDTSVKRSLFEEQWFPA